MTGLTRLLAAPSTHSSLIGILYAEDFDDPQSETPELAEPAPQITDAPPSLTQDHVDDACQAAVAAARLQWQQESEQSRTSLLAEIATALGGAREAAELLAASAAEATAKTVLAMLSGALPRLCREHGAAEAQAIIDHLLPMLRSQPRVIVRVHPDMAPELRREFLDREVEFTGTLAVLPTAAEPGDVKIEWENGFLARDTRQILQAMQDVLGQLGLLHPQETTPKRRLAHAE